MKFEKLDINGHIILRAMLELDKDADTLAQAQSARKAEKVHRDAPSGRRRSIDEVNSQNYLGTLADIVCARLLEGYFKNTASKLMLSDMTTSGRTIFRITTNTT